MTPEITLTLALSSTFAFAAPEQSDALRGAIEQAMEQAMDEDLDTAIAGLAAALEEIEGDPEQATALGPSELVLEARVMIVRLHLAKGDARAAEDAMDDLVRVARDRNPPVREYGGRVTKLYEARKRALTKTGTATLVVECEEPCEVVVAGQRADGSSAIELLLGDYRVWIRTIEADVEWEERRVELLDAGAVVTESYAEPTAPQPQVPTPGTDLDATSTSAAVREAGPSQSIDAPPPRRVEPQEAARIADEPARRSSRGRALPRAVEVAGLIGGVGLAVAGGVLLSFDARCSASPQPASEDVPKEECGDIYESTPGSAALLGIGGGLVLISGVMVTVDEVRVGRARGRQVMLGATFSF